jgi:hypothetical protein
MRRKDEKQVLRGVCFESFVLSTTTRLSLLHPSSSCIFARTLHNAIFEQLTWKDQEDRPLRKHKFWGVKANQLQFLDKIANDLGIQQVRSLKTDGEPF